MIEITSVYFVLDNLVLWHGNSKYRVSIKEDELLDWLNNPADVKEITNSTYVYKDGFVYICCDGTYRVDYKDIMKAYDSWLKMFGKRSVFYLTYCYSDKYVSFSKDINNSLELLDITEEQYYSLCNDLLNARKSGSGIINVGKYELCVTYKEFREHGRRVSEYIRITASKSVNEGSEYLGTYSYNYGKNGKSFVEVITDKTTTL